MNAFDRRGCRYGDDEAPASTLRVPKIGERLGDRSCHHASILSAAEACRGPNWRPPWRASGAASRSIPTAADFRLAADAYGVVLLQPAVSLSPKPSQKTAVIGAKDQSSEPVVRLLAEVR